MPPRRDSFPLSDTPINSAKADSLLSPRERAQAIYKSPPPLRNPYNTIKDSRLAELILSGAIAVIRASYFEDCFVRGLPFGRRQDVPFMFIWPGPTAIDNWMKGGKCFLCNVSYSWLSKAHPDPNLFHLPRLVRIFAEFQKLWSVKDFGVIIDFCSVWQPEEGRESVAHKDMRSERGKPPPSYERSLEEINVPYGHRGVTSFVLADVPPDEPRKFDNRGWTLFEEIMIDSKGGDWNRWIFRDFDIKATWPDSYAFFTHARLDGRRVPVLPEDFEAMIEARRQRMEAENVELFSGSADMRRVTRYYRAAFAYISSETKLVYDGLGWTDSDMIALMKLLLHYEHLQQLHLRNNKFGELAAKELAATIPKLPKLQSLALTGNPLCRLYATKLMVQLAWTKMGKPQRLLEF